MKVRHTGLGAAVETDDSLTVGREYHVIEVEMQAGKAVDIRVLADDGIPILVPIDRFSIVDPKLIGDWGVDRQGGVTTIAPPAFLRHGFWERYFNADGSAREEFSRVMAELTKTSL